MLRYYHHTLTSLFADLNQLGSDPSNVPLCFSIQERLLTHIRRTEFRIRATKQQFANLKNAIRHGRLPREETTKLKQKITINDSKKQAYDQLLAILRDIGDGIAFIYLNKWDIKPLCMSKELAGHISRKKGIRLELKIFRYYKSKNVTCIFNDITNSLRHGDITIPKHGMPIIIEAKSGSSSKTDNRSQRQMERGKNILKYLVEDQGDDVYPGQNVPLQRRSLTINERHHRRKLERLLAKMLACHQNITARIEKGLYYNVSVTGESIEKELNKLPKGAKWCPFFANSQKLIKQAYYPFTLSIKLPEALFAFYDGQSLITVFVDLNVVEELFRERGFSVYFCDDDTYFMRIDTANASMPHVQVSHHFMGRLGAEFLSLKWMIYEMCNWISQPTESPYVKPTFVN